MSIDKKPEYDLVIVIPTLNEENGIRVTIESIKKALNTKMNYKIIVVDTLSTDKTVEVAKSLGATVLTQRVKGYGAALQTGFYFVDKNLKTLVTVMMDADGTYDPQDIPKMVEIIKNGEADFVIGNRFAHMDKKAMPVVNKIGNKILSYFSRKLLQIEITDFSSGIRAIKSSCLRIFYNRTIDFSYATEMVAITRTYLIPIKEIPVYYHNRIGDSKLSPFKDGSRILGTIIRLMRDTRPLMFFGLIGITLTSIGVIFGVEVLLEWLKTGKILKIPTTILSVLLIMLGVQSLTTGLLSDMIKSKEYREHIFLEDFQ